MLEGLDITPYLVMMTFIAAIAALVAIRGRLRLRNGQAPALDIMIGNGQTIGTREEQDDYFASASTATGTIAVLADGISGLSNGRMSSTIAVKTFIKEYLKLSDLNDVPSFLTKAARLTNSEILRNLAGSSGGTTLVAAIIKDSRLYWGAVGDSVLIVYRNGDFIPVNRKHVLETVLEERVLSGELTREEVRGNPMRKRLVNYLGFDSFQNIEIGSEPFSLKSNDKILLLSDGVYNTLSEVEMEQVLSKRLTPDEAADQMIEVIERKRLKHQDNATILILEPAV
ncbi:hypothetical protein PAECIP111893_00012 [Paenibacillus plantiphilus]|uniref:PPM-type phosphatase domain-containing protein n=1 Tax=Paenibacillus plantiphilus TaxID=2905650 RepID=A0ABM9BMR6_9BACL|nr:protein phosphatase 2C domain-containing protein [Paenibacillus plantiphilus]CAH1189914.1 hypothetical protein PAECIP111893_00012 [Paenibacillus plantiphilus]